jgi:hypothetical protein
LQLRDSKRHPRVLATLSAHARIEIGEYPYCGGPDGQRSASPDSASRADPDRSEGDEVQEYHDQMIKADRDAYLADKDAK